MPELPEVETTVRGLRKLKGLVVKDIWTDYFSPYYKNKREIKNIAFFSYFKKKTIGGKFIDTKRIGKNILIHLSNGNTIVVHMKMTGHLLYGKYRRATKEERKRLGESWLPCAKTGYLTDTKNKFIHLVFTFSNGKHLVLSDLRKFARVFVSPIKKLLERKELSSLGPDPLKNMPYTVFKKIIESKKGPVKKVLMDQKIFSGIGNIYSDEALWISGIHPKQVIKNMDEKTLRKLFLSIVSVLKKGIIFKGDSTSDYRDISGKKGLFQNKHQAYRRTGKHCGKRGCIGVIMRTKVGGRSAHFCSQHQKILE